MESNIKLPIAYRTRQCDMLSVPESTSFLRRLSVKTAPEKPRFIIVGFQMNKDGDQTKNPSTINHVNPKIAYVTLNSDRYPAVDYNLSFPNQKFSMVYGDVASFGVKFFAKDELITQSNIATTRHFTLFSRSMSPIRKKNSNPLLLISI